MKRAEVYRTRERVPERGNTKLTQFVATLSPAKITALNRALAHALELLHPR